jgi:hypothetical protein
MIDDALYKNVEKLDVQFMKYIRSALEKEYVPLVKKEIMDEYDNALVNPVTDRRSKTNPILYKREFEDALDTFQFLVDGDTTTTFVMPDMENFPFDRGRLRIVKNILEGVIGTYVEVDEEQYITLFGKRAVLSDPYDKTVSSKERIYLVRYTNDIQRREYQLFKKPTFVRYPFSNSPPIRLFDPAEKFVKENYATWLNTILNKATKVFVKGEFTYNEL